MSVYEIVSIALSAGAIAVSVLIAILTMGIKRQVKAEIYKTVKLKRVEALDKYMTLFGKANDIESYTEFAFYAASVSHLLTSELARQARLVLMNTSSLTPKQFLTKKRICEELVRKELKKYLK